MFSKFVIFLLKFFDLCGFQTESARVIGSRNRAICIFVIHCGCAFALTYFVFGYASEPILLGEVLPYFVNEILQILNGMLTHWVIIIESFIQRGIQKKFWDIYQKIDKNRVKCKKSLLRAYKMKFIEFFSVVTIIQTIFMCYFTHYVGNYYFFRIAYLVSQTVYHYRVFYYLFYVELIKFELQAIETELRTIAKITQRNEIDSNPENFNANSLKMINAHCQLILQLNECINKIFGWSNFITVTYCFHMPLTDFNWALWELHRRTRTYITGINGILFHVFTLFSSQQFSVFVIWIIHLAVIIGYLFHGTSNCQVEVIFHLLYFNGLFNRI